MQWQPKHPAFRALLDAVLAEAAPVYAVGGVVRDHLLGRRDKLTDLDLVVETAALPTARRVADRLGWAFYPLDQARDVARLVFTRTGGEPLICDIARIRGWDIESDLTSRDFTINAMAFALEPGGRCTLIDLCGGQADLDARVLRRVSAVSMAEDPLRMLRAARLLVEFDLTLDEKTQDQIERMGDTIRLSSPERMRDELWKMLAGPNPHEALEILRILGLLQYVLPELDATVGMQQSFPHHLDVYRHTLLAVRRTVELRDWLMAPQADAELLPGNWKLTLMPWRTQLRRHFMENMGGGRSRADWLIWHALLHDVGKPATQSAEMRPSGSIHYRFLGHEDAGADLATERAAFLRFSRQEIALVDCVIRAHMRPHHLHASFHDREISRRALHRYFRDVNSRHLEAPAGVDTLILALADYQAIYEVTPPDWRSYQAHTGQMLTYVYTDQGMADVKLRPLVDGHLLMRRLDLTPGPQIGRLLEHVLEAQAAGEITTQAEALDLARAWLDKEP